jgi:hypothetical protein
VTSLARHGRFLTAKFPPVKVPCSYPRGSSYSRRRYGQSHDYYKLQLSSDGTRIHAIEYRLCSTDDRVGFARAKQGGDYYQSSLMLRLEMPPSLLWTDRSERRKRT